MCNAGQVLLTALILLLLQQMCAAGLLIKSCAKQCLYVLMSGRDLHACLHILNALAGKYPGVSYFDVSMNMLTGPLPDSMYGMFPNATELYLIGNDFDGVLPAEVGCIWQT